MSQEDSLSPDGAIQPIGFLVTLSSDWRIGHVSANIGDFLNIAVETPPGQAVTGLFSPAAIHSLRNRLALLRGPNATERLFGISLTGDDAHYDVAVHMSGSHAIVEAEPNREHHHDRESSGTVRGMIAQLEELDSLRGFFSEAARQVRALTGYERVAIHRFDDTGKDEIVGAAARNGFAAVDAVPLGTEPSSPVKLVADVDAQLVAMIPALEGHVDLSRAALRAASPSELDRLRETGLHAGLSIGLMVRGRQWGVIACQHHTPFCPSFERRSAAEWYAVMLAMQIEIRELRARLA